MKEDKPSVSEEELLLKNPLIFEIFLDNMELSQASREVAVHVAGYVGKQIVKKYSCCQTHVVGVFSTSNPDHAYIKTLSRGGLTIPSSNLTEYVCTTFAVLDWINSALKQSKIPVRRAAHISLENVFEGSLFLNFSCDFHRRTIQHFINQALINIFFNNKRKITTSSVIKDGVVDFKKCKRSKEANK